VTNEEKIAVLERRVRRMEAALGDLAGTVLGEKSPADGFETLRLWFDALIEEIERKTAGKQKREGT
jgi:hypothetical protein